MFEMKTFLFHFISLLIFEELQLKLERKSWLIYKIIFVTGKYNV